MIGSGPQLAVAIHGIEPASFERCASIRDWLTDHGVGRVTLLVVPARDLHPLADRSPELAAWLVERERAGDAIAQHGFRLSRPASGGSLAGGLALLRGERSLRALGPGEFSGLDIADARRAVESGRRTLKLAGVDPQGFVAPAYAYTPALRKVLRERFGWWLELGSLRLPTVEGQRQAGGAIDLPAPLLFSDGGAMHALTQPWQVRLRARRRRDLLRIDLQADYLGNVRQMLALESVMRRCARSRTAVTYEQLAAGARAAAATLAAPSPLSSPGAGMQAAA